MHRGDGWERFGHMSLIEILIVISMSYHFNQMAVFFSFVFFGYSFCWFGATFTDKMSARKKSERKKSEASNNS